MTQPGFAHTAGSDKPNELTTGVTLLRSCWVPGVHAYTPAMHHNAWPSTMYHGYMVASAHSHAFNSPRGSPVAGTKGWSPWSSMYNARRCKKDHGRTYQFQAQPRRLQVGDREPHILQEWPAGSHTGDRDGRQWKPTVQPQGFYAVRGKQATQHLHACFRYRGVLVLAKLFTPQDQVLQAGQCHPPPPRAAHLCGTRHVSDYQRADTERVAPWDFHASADSRPLASLVRSRLDAVRTWGGAALCQADCIAPRGDGPSHRPCGCGGSGVRGPPDSRMLLDTPDEQPVPIYLHQEHRVQPGGLHEHRECRWRDPRALINMERDPAHDLWGEEREGREVVHRQTSHGRGARVGRESVGRHA
ncbi:hypothetical protein K439DRAFT_1620781 [Ramaria rubella]|nr:hypothetical protein K439DRAFT_1620781 [Ramaria rubella]